jgi:hypothetical protein
MWYPVTPEAQYLAHHSANGVTVLLRRDLMEKKDG